MFNCKDSKGKLLEGKEAVRKAIEVTEEAGKLVSGFLKSPHDFEFDKVYWPFIIFAKKRYVGNKYEEVDHFKETSMGIVLKRRDNAPILKTIYGGAVDILLNQRDVAKAAQYVKDGVLALVQGTTPIGQLVISKSLQSKYRGTPPAHKMLADRIAERDPGNAPAAGERIPYIYVLPPVGQLPGALQGDRVESPAYVKEKGLKPDFRYYIEHQLISPISQLFGLCVEKIPGFQGSIHDELSKKEKMAEHLLFDAALQRCNKNSMRAFVEKAFNVTVADERKVSFAKRTVTAINGKEPEKKQTQLSSYFLDKMILEAGKKKK
jgi:DNA polymerase elongation subunit (family B)